MQPYSIPPDLRTRSCRSYLPYSPGYCPDRNRRPEAHLACFPDLILKAGAKLHADIQVLGLVQRRAAHVEAQPNGYHQGGILFPSLNLSFGGYIHGQCRDLDHVSRRMAHTAEEGHCACVAILAANRLNSSPPSPIKVMPLTMRRFLNMACSRPAPMCHP